MAELSLLPREIKNIPNAIFLEVAGICDVTSEDKLKNMLGRLVKSGFARFIIDLAGLKFLNSNGFAQFVALSDKLRQIGGKLVLYAVPKDIFEMSQYLGLNEFFEFAQSYDEGIQIIGGINPESSTNEDSYPEIRLQSFGPPPTQSPSEASNMNSTKHYSQQQGESGEVEKEIARIAVLTLTTNIVLNKHYPVKVRICKKENFTSEIDSTIETICCEHEFIIPAENPYITILPKFPGCKINPIHTNIDVSIDNSEYSFWILPTNPELIGEAFIQFWYGNEILTFLKTLLHLKQI
ncbi:MAG: STAS domain-containing protein [Planctomycetes bacterium]|nr:STAS domain-containing protein [Planctomycetota bacterium]